MYGNLTHEKGALVDQRESDLRYNVYVKKYTIY